MSNELWCRSARSIAEGIRAGRVSAQEEVELHLERIAEVNPKINAVVQLAADRARAEARTADALLAKGEVRGPLHGVPVTIKDSFDTAGIVTTGGTVGRRTFVPDEDATVVARLRGAGAIVLGKTNTPELTLGDDTENAVYGRTRNPYDLARSPSGSSGGAAAIIAAGGAALDIGSDTGGSIRGPAHACGIAGIKPTSGRVPLTGHITPPGFGAIASYSQAGPMARWVEDLELCLPIVAGVDRQDPSVVPVPLRDPGDVRLGDLRLLTYTDNGVIAPVPAVADVVTGTARALEPLVAGVDDHCPALLAEGKELFVRLYQADGGAAVRRLLQRCGTERPGGELERNLAGITPVDGERFSETLEQVADWRRRMLGLMEDYDAILCPAAPFPPEPFDRPQEDRYIVWSHCMVFNLAGWPAAVVRAGGTADGLPIGVQIVGPPWREDLVLALAKVIESHSGGFQPPDL